tara:strand:- start:68 stop:250 length:183 start_codon:yes stop_codon:yes gene_type:complete
MKEYKSSRHIKLILPTNVITIYKEGHRIKVITKADDIVEWNYYRTMVDEIVSVTPTQTLT